MKDDIAEILFFSLRCGGAISSGMDGGVHSLMYIQCFLCQPLCHLPSKNKFSSVQSLDRLGHWGDMRDDLVEILFQPFLQEAIVSSSGTGRDVHSLMLSIQYFLCRPQCHPLSKVP